MQPPSRSARVRLDVRQAWVEAVRDSNVCVLEKVGTSDNLADFFTKILEHTRFEDLRDRMMCRHRCAGDNKGASQHRAGTVTAP